MILNNKEDVEEVPLGRAKNLTKIHFNHLKPIYRIKTTSKKTMWLCQCECGNYFTISAERLINNQTQSCGCIKTEAQMKAYKSKHLNLIGLKFGRWTVLEKVENKRSSNGHILWKCECDCGTIGFIDGTSLKNGNSKSCGCLSKELLRARDLERIEDLTNRQFGEITVIEKTQRSDLKNGVIWKCKCSCGNICYKTTSALKKNKICSCGCITQSKGSLTIEKLLQENKISFIKEYKFENCKNINSLPFDFYLPDYNILIEFDGEQHFKSKPHFDDIKYIHNNDIIKNNFCFENQLYLIRISYNNYQNLNIEDLLFNSKYHVTLDNIENYYKENNYGVE